MELSIFVHPDLSLEPSGHLQDGKGGQCYVLRPEPGLSLMLSARTPDERGRCLQWLAAHKAATNKAIAAIEELQRRSESVAAQESEGGEPS